jgi:hypothetical protein
MNIGKQIRLSRKALFPLLILMLLLNGACVYIVLPDEEVPVAHIDSQGWSAAVTNVSAADGGGLHIDLAVRNDTLDWSAMQAIPEKPAVLTGSGGKSSNCDTVFVSSGGHRLPPGFRARGFTAGTKKEPEIQMIYVECGGAQASDGAKLSLDYSYVTGELNYYDQEANKVFGNLSVNLDEVQSDLQYPVGTAMEGLIHSIDTPITAINDIELQLAGVTRTENGLQLNWQTTNKSEYPGYVHIGTPPVIGTDGILYGYYEIMDLVSVPVTPAEDIATWTTEVIAPVEAGDLTLLLSVESKKQRWYVNYAVDLSGY